MNEATLRNLIERLRTHTGKLRLPMPPMLGLPTLVTCCVVTREGRY